MSANTAKRKSAKTGNTVELALLVEPTARTVWEKVLGERSADRTAEGDGPWRHEREGEPAVEITLFDSTRTAGRVLGSRPFDAIVLDNSSSEAHEAFSDTPAGSFLPELLAGPPGGRPPSRRSIFVILSNTEDTPFHSYSVGSLQLGGVVISDAPRLDILLSISRSVRPAAPGKVALCLAGGGIEGLFYELGVLRAIDASLDDCSVLDFDIISGISAGAIIGAFLANGVSPYELAEALKGRASRVGKITRGMMFDPNVGELAARLFGAGTDILRGKWLREPLDEALKVTPTALFSGDKMRWFLEREFNKPGMTNDFEKLERELYIGASDQDSGTHVTFGEEGARDVPISHACRASAAMTPYYPPERIGGRYFVDGIFTRTINLDVAVAHGADLVICVDPLTPVQVDQAGYVSSRGGLFNTVQVIKSMIRTRLSEVIGRAAEAYPNVSVHVFSPTSRDLEQMSGTLMRFFYSTETEEMAYRSAREKIEREIAWFDADLRRHGLALRK